MNSKTTSINVKVSAELKQEAQQLADELGIPLTTVIAAQLKDFVKSRSVTLSVLPRLDPVIEKEVLSAIERYESGVFQIHRNRQDTVRFLRSIK